MKTDQPEQPHWNDDQIKILDHEALISEILRRRASALGKSKSAFLSFFESVSGAAFITVAIGGLFGTWINSNIQEASQKREVTHANEKTRGELALASYKDFLEKQNDFVKLVHERVSAVTVGCEDLFKLSLAENSNRAGLNPADSNVVLNKRSLIKKKYNEASERWRADSAGFGSTLGYYFPAKSDSAVSRTALSSTTQDDTSVVSIWRNLAPSLDAYRVCAEKWAEDERVRTEEEIATACSGERKTVNTNVASLTEALQRNRQYAWNYLDISENPKADRK